MRQLANYISESCGNVPKLCCGGRGRSMNKIGTFLRGMIGAALLFGAATPGAAVTYIFEGRSAFPGGHFGVFEITLPSPVTQNSVFDVSKFSSCTVLSNPDLSCGNHGFTFTTVAGFGVDGNMIEFAAVDGGLEITRSFFYFAPGAFGANGVYENIAFGEDQGGTLRVSGIGSPAVPEPGTWAMLILGFAMVGAAVRYRRSKGHGIGPSSLLDRAATS